MRRAVTLIARKAPMGQVGRPAPGCTVLVAACGLILALTTSRQGSSALGPTLGLRRRSPITTARGGPIHPTSAPTDERASSSLTPSTRTRSKRLFLRHNSHVAKVAKKLGFESMMLRKMIKDGPRLPAAMDEAFEIAVDETVDVLYEGPRNRLYAPPETICKDMSTFL